MRKPESTKKTVTPVVPALLVRGMLQWLTTTASTAIPRSPSRAGRRPRGDRTVTRPASGTRRSPSPIGSASEPNGGGHGRPIGRTLDAAGPAWDVSDEILHFAPFRR